MFTCALLFVIDNVWHDLINPDILICLEISYRLELEPLAWVNNSIFSFPTN